MTFLFIVGLSYGLMKFLASQKEDLRKRPSIEAKRYVKAQPVEYKKIISPVSEMGRVASVAEVDIVTEASGRIQRGNVSLKKGAGFSKGDVLFVVYPDEAALDLKASKARFLNTLANLLPDIKIDYPQYEKEYMDFFSSIDLDKPLPSFPEVEDEKMKMLLIVSSAILVLVLFTGIQSFSACDGDFDCDGDVDGSDLAVFAADFGRTDCGSNIPKVIGSVSFQGLGEVDLRSLQLALYWEVDTGGGGSRKTEFDDIKILIAADYWRSGRKNHSLATQLGRR